LEMLAVDEEYIAFMRLIVGESGRFPELGQLFVRSLPQKAWTLLSHYFTAHPELHSPNPEATARIFMGTLVSYVLTQKVLHGQEIMPISQEAMIDCLVETIVRHPG
ncbi:TetR family transcriptional regulator, partial [filamentous cyanobacterium CCP5]